MAPTRPHPVIVIVPGSSQTPSHYATLSHFLHQRGYPTLCALLPTTGTSSPATVDDDIAYVRDRMLLPLLDFEGRDVVLVTHSYSALPGGAAARGLGKAERSTQGKTTGIIGQIYIAAVLSKGGDGKDVLTCFGGQLPPHLWADEPMNLLRSDGPKPSLYQDVEESVAAAAIAGCLCPNLTMLRSPVPPASWDSDGFKGRCAFVRTLNDLAVPPVAQDMMIESTGQQWIVKDIESGHSPQLAAPEQLADILIELTNTFETI